MKNNMIFTYPIKNLFKCVKNDKLGLIVVSFCLCSMYPLQNISKQFNV